MPRINRKVIKKLFENYFGQSIHFQDDDWDDVPDIKDDKEFTTQLPLDNPINAAGTDTIGPLAVKANFLKAEQALEKIKRNIEQELELKLKSGKDLLQDPSSSATKDEDGKKVLFQEPKPLKEQKKDEVAAGTAPATPPQGGQTGQIVQGGAGVDPNTGQPVEPLIPGAPPPLAVDPMTGLPIQPQEEKTPKDIGRTYELKKIYSRLVAVDSYLSSSSDQVLLKLRKYINKSLDMFDVLNSNFGTFKDQIDDIIVIYYKFIDSVYDILRRYYEDKKDDDEKENRATMKDVAMVDLDKLASQEKI
jgi:hypothetical protein